MLNPYRIDFNKLVSVHVVQWTIWSAWRRRASTQSLTCGSLSYHTITLGRVLRSDKLFVFDRFCFFSPVAMNNAVQLWDGHLSVITRPVPRVQNPLDVVIKITYSAICGTDLKILEGKFPCEKSVIMGHEFVGVVKEAGSEVKHVTVGDR